MDIGDFSVFPMQWGVKPAEPGELIDLALSELPVGGCSIDGMVEDLDAVKRRYLHLPSAARN